MKAGRILRPETKIARLSSAITQAAPPAVAAFTLASLALGAKKKRGWGWGWGNTFGLAPEETYIQKVLSYSPDAYWPMNEASGSAAICQVNAAQNGTYTGVTLGQTGIGDGETCPLFDGTNDYLDIDTATLVSNFNGAEGTLSLWIRVSGAGVWTDGTARFIARLEVDGSNNVTIHRKTTNNILRFNYDAGGSTKIQESTVTTTDWLHASLTWSKTADKVIYYLAGVQSGATDTGLGTWAGSLATIILGAETTGPADVWDGYLAHAAIFDTAIDAASIADLATV